MCGVGGRGEDGNFLSPEDPSSREIISKPSVCYTGSRGVL